LSITRRSRLIEGNFIGTDPTGTVALGNSGDGVYINNTPNNMIGGTTPAARNVISASTDYHGIEIVFRGATDNLVQGNFIGTDATGSRSLANSGDGVRIHDASHNTIGGTTPEAGNVISGNGLQGIEITGDGARDNLVQGNYIGVDVSGEIALGNGLVGIFVLAGAQSNRIGSDADGIADASERNVISGNGSSGVAIRDAGSMNNVVAGNYIGTDDQFVGEFASDIPRSS
jgi:titin